MGGRASTRRGPVAKVSMCLLVVVAALGFLTDVAAADNAGLSGSTNSTSSFTTGWTQRIQSHNGDDISFDQDTGHDLVIRWAKCSDPNNVHGASIHQSWSWGYLNIGTNFSGGTCFVFQYRGYNSTGGFSGHVSWNANFA